MKFVFCVGMFRSCSTWQYDVASHVVETHLGGARLGFVDWWRFMELTDQGFPAASVVVMKAHEPHPVYDEVLGAGRVTPLYSYRDLRDVAFSYMHKARLSFDELVEQRFLESVLETDAYWRARPGVLCQRYESIVADPPGGVRGIAAHLGVRLGRGEARRIASAYSWSANLERTRGVKSKAEAAGLDLGHKDHVFEHDPVTLLHWNHLREGQRKGWRELATPGQREILGRMCGAWLVSNGYEHNDAWVERPELSRSGAAGARPWFARTRTDGPEARAAGWLKRVRRGATRV
jgi:hypothetical protein